MCTAYLEGWEQSSLRLFISKTTWTESTRGSESSSASVNSEEDDDCWKCGMDPNRFEWAAGILIKKKCFPFTCKPCVTRHVHMCGMTHSIHVCGMTHSIHVPNVMFHMGGFG